MISGAPADELARRVFDRMMERDEFSRWMNIEALEIGSGNAKLRMPVRAEMIKVQIKSGENWRL